MYTILKTTLTFAVGIALIAVASTTFAQNNTATIKQLDIPKGLTEADIDQPGSDNEGTIIQGQLPPTRNREGVKKSDAAITQAGHSGEARILQGVNGGFSAKSHAQIFQKGDSYAEILQGWGNFSGVEANNSGRQRQIGRNHTAKIHQGVRTGTGSLEKSRSNDAIQVQRGGNGSSAFIKQGVDTGSDSDGSFARQVQAGSRHDAEISQGTSGFEVTAGHAVQKQFGSDNSSTIIQTGLGPSAEVVQN